MSSLCSTCHFMIIMCEQAIWFLAAHSLALIGCQFSLMTIPIKKINRVTAFSICTKILLKHWWFFLLNHRYLEYLGNHHLALHVHAWHAYTMYIDFCGDLPLVVASILHLTYYKLLIKVDYKNNYNKIKSTNVLMPRWSCRGIVHTECLTIHDCWQLLTCMQVILVFNAAKL